MFRGAYMGRNVHSSDLRQVLARAQAVGVEKIMITAGCLEEAQEAVSLAQSLRQEFPSMAFATTVGVHPTRTSEFENFPEGADSYLNRLVGFVRRHRELGMKAIGELGLDYNRLQYSSPEVQKVYFERQFVLAEETGLPLFLHMRDAGDDFVEVVKRNRHRFSQGVVHSFTGTIEESRAILDLNLFIGINGCSLKTAENLQVVKTIPVERIMVESDAPWCEIRPSSAAYQLVATKYKGVAKEKYQPETMPDSMVKSRNEPFCCIQVLEVIAALHQQNLEEVSEIIFRNTNSVFG